MERDEVRKTYEAGELIVREGEQGNEWYIIEEGRVKVYTDVEGERNVLTTLGEGQIIGELSSVEQTERTANVEAIDEVTCLMLAPEHLDQFLEDNPDFRQTLFQTLATRVAETTQEVTRLRHLEQYLRKATVAALGLFQENGRDESVQLDAEPLAEQMADEFPVSEEELEGLVQSVRNGDGLPADEQTQLQERSVMLKVLDGLFKRKFEQLDGPK